MLCWAGVMAVIGVAISLAWGRDQPAQEAQG
jgi:hypothetical protein